MGLPDKLSIVLVLKKNGFPVYLQTLKPIHWRQHVFVVLHGYIWQADSQQMGGTV